MAFLCILGGHAPVVCPVCPSTWAIVGQRVGLNKHLRVGFSADGPTPTGGPGVGREAKELHLVGCG